MREESDAVPGIAGLFAAPNMPQLLKLHARDCRICCGPHDQEIHDASVSIRSWFRSEVTKNFDVSEENRRQA